MEVIEGIGGMGIPGAHGVQGVVSEGLVSDQPEIV